jgi:hypothetical protein
MCRSHTHTRACKEEPLHTPLRTTPPRARFAPRGRSRGRDAPRCAWFPRRLVVLCCGPLTLSLSANERTKTTRRTGPTASHRMREPELEGALFSVRFPPRLRRRLPAHTPPRPVMKLPSPLANYEARTPDGRSPNRISTYRGPPRRAARTGGSRPQIVVHT